MKDNRLVKDHTVCIEDYTMTRTKKVYAALDELCYTFDLAKPIWLKSNQQDFIRHARTRFTQDNFIESIDQEVMILFDEFDKTFKARDNESPQVIEEDY